MHVFSKGFFLQPQISEKGSSLTVPHDTPRMFTRGRVQTWARLQQSRAQAPCCASCHQVAFLFSCVHKSSERGPYCSPMTGGAALCSEMEQHSGRMCHMFEIRRSYQKVYRMYRLLLIFFRILKPPELARPVNVCGSAKEEQVEMGSWRQRVRDDLGFGEGRPSTGGVDSVCLKMLRCDG